MSRDQWGEYLRAKEPYVREKTYAWNTANYTTGPNGIKDTTECLELFSPQSAAGRVERLAKSVFDRRRMGRPRRPHK